MLIRRGAGGAQDPITVQQLPDYMHWAGWYAWTGQLIP
jgi:hypothetical protein